MCVIHTLLPTSCRGLHVWCADKGLVEMLEDGGPPRRPTRSTATPRRPELQAPSCDSIVKQRPSELYAQLL